MPIPLADIMIVDDTPALLRLLTKVLKEGGYKVRPFPSGRLALKAAEASPPDMILLDINMPEMDGYEVCDRLKGNDRLKDIPVLFISALNKTMDKVKAFSVGGVDFVTKPFQFEEIEARVRTHLQLRHLQAELEKHNFHLQELVEEQVKEISDSQMAMIFALAKLAESRDDSTGKHIERVQDFCRLLSESLRDKHDMADAVDDFFVENVFRASPLHDIGKVGIPDSILQKPGKLTPDEFTVMKTHTTMGSTTLEAVREQYPNNAFVEMGIAIARSHHEWWDGGGYPEGLSGESIPLSARIMAVADVYDALRSERCYKPAYSHEKSVGIIVGGSDTQFDPSVVAAFNDTEDQFIEISERKQ